MRSLYPCLLLITLSAAANAQPAPRVPPSVSHAGKRETLPGPTRNFIGKVTVEPLVTPTAPGRAVLGLVTFSPGARSNWHTHPAGQSLYVTHGCGLTQREGGAVEKICKGDVVHVPAGMRHWHGATETTTMTHLAVSEMLDGKNVVWAEPVSDAQYHAGVGAR
ncbi:cupin domain-containing protein [Novosphingobium sp. 11B]